MAETWFVWLCCSGVEECDSREDALDERYGREDSDNSCQVQQIEGPNGQTITDKEFNIYSAARAAKSQAQAAEYAKRQDKPIGTIKVKPPWDIKGSSKDFWGWSYVASPKTEEEKDRLLAQYIKVLGEDRVVFLPKKED